MGGDPYLTQADPGMAQQQQHMMMQQQQQQQPLQQQQYEDDEDADFSPNGRSRRIIREIIV